MRNDARYGSLSPLLLRPSGSEDTIDVDSNDVRVEASEICSRVVPAAFPAPPPASSPVAPSVAFFELAAAAGFSTAAGVVLGVL